MPEIGVEAVDVWPYYITYDRADFRLQVTEEEYTWIIRTERRVTEVQEFLSRKIRESSDNRNSK